MNLGQIPTIDAAGDEHEKTGKWENKKTGQQCLFDFRVFLFSCFLAFLYSARPCSLDRP